jgi:uncharacterized protein YgfB (UPF0149 family)
MTTPYSTLRQLIAHLDDTLTASPAALHGLWVGRMSAGSLNDTHSCWSYTLRYLGRTEAVDSNLAKAFQALMHYTLGDLDKADFSFELWLPDDRRSCQERLLALAEWCRGFLEGLVSVTGNDLNTLSADTRELLQDLMEIGDVDTDIDECDQDEREYLELAEFVKVAALNIFLDIQSGRNRAEAALASVSGIAALTGVGDEKAPTLH